MLSCKYKWQIKLFLLWTAVAISFCGCGFQAEKPAHRDLVQLRKDSRGRIIYRKFDQLIDNYNGSSLATITQYFDTLGRLVSEFGTDHPKYGKQYLYEIFYRDSIKVVNYFRWPYIDTSNLDFIPPSAFVEQKIQIDSATFLKTIIVTKVGIDKNVFVGKYFENFPSKRERDGYVPYLAYTFNMPLRNFIFDEATRLHLKEITIVGN